MKKVVGKPGCFSRFENIFNTHIFDRESKRIALVTFAIARLINLGF